MKIRARLLAMLLAGFMMVETCPIAAFAAELPPTDTTTLTEPSDPLTSQEDSDSTTSLESQVESTQESQVESTLESQAESTLESQVESTLESQVESTLESQLESDEPLLPNNSLSNDLDALNEAEEEEEKEEKAKDVPEDLEPILKATSNMRLSLNQSDSEVTVYFSSFSSNHNYTARLLKLYDAEQGEELTTWKLTACKPDAKTGVCAQTLSLKPKNGVSLMETGESYQLQLTGSKGTQVQNFTVTAGVSDVTAHLSGGSFNVSWSSNDASKPAPSGYVVQLFSQSNLLKPLATAKADADATSASISTSVPKEAFAIAVTPQYTLVKEPEASEAEAEVEAETEDGAEAKAEDGVEAEAKAQAAIELDTLGQTSYTTNASIDVPANLTAKAGDAAATLRFQPVSTASAYNIYRNGSLLTTVSAKNLQKDSSDSSFVLYTDKTASNGVSYKYQVQAVLTIGQTEEPEEEKPLDATEKITLKTGVVANTASVYVRKGPSTSSAILDEYRKGKSVKIVGESGSFYQIDGGGYISKIRIKIQKTSTSSVKVRIYDNVVSGVIYNTASVYVRQGPSTSYPILNTLKKGATVQVRGESGDFYAIKGVGFISKTRVKLSKPGTSTGGTSTASTTDTLYAKTISGTIVNTASVYIRQGPSASTAILGTLKKGASIQVTGVNGDFYKTTKGYISKIRVKLKESPTYFTPNTPEEFKENEIQSKLSAQSDAVTPVIVVPGEIENLTTQIGNQSITLTWDAVKVADYYQVYRYDAASKTFKALAKATTNSYRNTGLKSGTTYQYKVQAVHQAGGQTAKGPMSDAVSEKASIMPGKVTNLKATVKETSVTLTWSKQTNANGYRVFTYDPKTKEKTKVADTSSLSYTAKNLTNNQKYYFVVCAYRTISGEKRLTDQTSDSISVTPKILTPSKPSNFKAVNADESVKLTWSRATNATTYQIYRKEIGVDSSYKLLGTFPNQSGTFPTTGTIVNTDSVYIRKGPSTSTTALGTLKRGETIQVTGESGDFYKINGGYVSKLRVQLTNASGPIPGTIANTESVFIREGPSTSSKVLGTLKKGATVQVTGISGDFYLTTVGYVSKLRVNLSSVANSTYTYVDDNLPNGKKYQYQIRSVRTSDKQAVYSGYVTSTQVTTSILPAAAPTNVQLKQTDTTNKLTWTAARKAEFYRVYLYNSKTGKYDQLIGDNLTSCSFTHTIPASSTTYYKYKIVSCRMNNGKVLESVTGASKNCYALKYTEKISAVRTIQYSVKIKSKAPYFSNDSSSTRLGTLSAGTKATELMRSNGRSKLKLSNGNQVWVSTSRLTRLSQNYNAKAPYSSSIAEAWVNYRGYSSPTSYLIWISQYTQRVYVFKGSKGNWKQHKCFTTGTGKLSTPTPMTTKAVWDKDPGWYDSWTYEIYCTKWYSLNAFHSRVKRYGGGYSDSRIGYPISNGCCRMYDSDCKWIYQNIPLKTTVVSF